MGMIILYAVLTGIGTFVGLVSLCAFITVQVLDDVVLGSTKNKVEKISIFSLLFSVFTLLIACMISVVA